MAERTRVGIIYQHNENWIGGTYYIQNLIAALCLLPEESKPALVIYCKTEKEKEEIKASGYPYLEFRELIYQTKNLPLSQRLANKLSYFFRGYDIYPQKFSLDTHAVDTLFPAPVGLESSSSLKKIYWIPDFQELHHPEFFSKQTILSRKQNHGFIARTKDDIVFSSLHAKEDFERLFPSSPNGKTVLRFAVTHPDLSRTDLHPVKEKYAIRGDYYFSPNQFWKHKNQQQVIEAAILLHKKGALDFEIVFTGKEWDDRNPDYVPAIKKMVQENNLQEKIRFLGFIDRKEQLKLMEGAMAVIQPSLFEGWSTVVEDVKAMNQWVIATAIPVHREQLTRNVSFFEPGDPAQLACILEAGKAKGFAKQSFPYREAVKEFAVNFVKLASN